MENKETIYTVTVQELQGLVEFSKTNLVYNHAQTILNWVEAVVKNSMDRAVVAPDGEK